MSTLSPPVTPSPVSGAFPPRVMETLHAELAITYLGALLGMAGSMVDLATEQGSSTDDAQEKAAAAMRRSLAEGPELLATLTRRPFEMIVEEFVGGARVPAAERRRAHRAHHAGGSVMTDLETALRRAAFWARRGMPRTAAELLSGTDGLLRFRADRGDLVAMLPGGEAVQVQLSPARRRVTITRTAGDHSLAGSADLPPHLVERVG